MPVFKVGNFNQIGVSFDQTAMVARAAPRAIRAVYEVSQKKTIKLAKTLPIYALQELSFRIEPPPMNLAKSPNKWGLYLKNLALYKSFEGFIANLFNPINQIYFTSITWDYSGAAPFVYPPKGARGSKFLIPIKPHTKRRLFIGDGVSLWPSRTVVGALNIVILVYECDDDVRRLGETLVEIHDKVENSSLASLITAISANPSLAIGVAIEKAVNELVGIIGSVMKRNVADYVDLFEGSYGTDKPQSPRIEKCDHESAGIELDFTIS